LAETQVIVINLIDESYEIQEATGAVAAAAANCTLYTLGSSNNNNNNNNNGITNTVTVVNEKISEVLIPARF
jgi:hypothetical protein